MQQTTQQDNNQLKGKKEKKLEWFISLFFFSRFRIGLPFFAFDFQYFASNQNKRKHSFFASKRKKFRIISLLPKINGAP
jgi:hypothetical protein